MGRTRHKTLKDECDRLWKESIYAFAEFKSEYSGKHGRQIGGDNILHAHHIRGKSSYALRYSFLNGVCLTSGEHKFIAHHQGRQDTFEKFIIKLRGKDVYDKLDSLKWYKGKTDLMATHAVLKQVWKSFYEKENTI